MRIIAGEFRGRRIAAPSGKDTRPMLDRVREALFGALGDLEGARVLDLFAGSGSLGIEALSRGAARARFVEDGRAALSVLRANLERVGAGSRAEVLRADALDRASWEAAERWDVVLLDPPYPVLASAARGALFAAARELALEHLADGGAVVLHTPERGVSPRDFGAGLDVRSRNYGHSALWYASPSDARADVEPGDVESADVESADVELADGEVGDGEPADAERRGDEREGVE